MKPVAEVLTDLKAAFPGDVVELSSNDNRHFSLLVVSEKFTGKTRVEQHQMVYQALGNAMEGAIHALAITTQTPK